MTTKEQKKKGGVVGCFPMCCITTETVAKKEKPVAEAPIVVKKTVSQEGVVDSNIPPKGALDAAEQAPVVDNGAQPVESIKVDDKPADQPQIEKEAVILIQQDDSTKEQKGSTAVTSNHEEPQLDKDQVDNNPVVLQDVNAKIEEAPAAVIQKEEKNDEENKADEAKPEEAQADNQIEDKKEEPAKVEEEKEKPKKKSFFSYFSRKPKTPANKSKEEVVVEEALKEEAAADKVEEVKEAADKVEEVKDAADKVEA